MEVGGNRLMKSNGCKSRAAKASEQAGSECCHSPGDWGVRSVHSKEVGREGSAPKSHIFAMPTPFARRKAASGTTAIARAARDRRSPKLRACFQRDFPQTQESSPSPLDREERRTPRETVGDRGRMEEQSYDPVVPAKVGNRRASERSGHGTHWREGGNKVTYLLKET